MTHGNDLHRVLLPCYHDHMTKRLTFTTVTPVRAPEGFVPLSECELTDEVLTSLGFTVRVTAKVVGTKVVRQEGFTFSAARSLAKAAGFVRFSTGAEWAAATAARKAKAKERVPFDHEVHAFMTRGT
jgi:hypothetical protein